MRFRVGKYEAVSAGPALRAGRAVPIAAWLAAAGLGLGMPATALAQNSAQGSGLEATPSEHDADVQFERGTHALRRGRVQEAIQILGDAHSRYGNDASIQAAYARALLAAGDADQAAALLEQLQATGRASPDDDVVLGLARYSDRDFQGARAALESAVQRDPNNAVAHLFLGSTLIELGDTAGAERHLADAERLDPSLASQVAYRRGRIALSQGDRARAESYFNEVEQLAPGSPVARASRRELSGRTRERPWSVYATLGVAYDSNVNLGGAEENELLAISGEDDARFFLEVGADYNVYDGERARLRIGTNHYFSKHINQEPFDLIVNRAFAVGALDLTDWLSFDARYTFEYVSTDSVDFRRTHAVEPSFRIRLRPDLLTRPFMRYEVRDFKQPQTFDSLERDGHILRAGLEQYYFPPDFTGYGQGFTRLRWNYRFEHTKGDQVTSGFDGNGGFFGIIPDPDIPPTAFAPLPNFLGPYGPEFNAEGNELELLAGMPLPWELFVLASVGYEWRNHEDRSFFDFSAGDREDRIQRYRLVLRRPIVEHVTAELGYRFTYWESNVDFFEFDRHIAHFLVTYRY